MQVTRHQGLVSKNGR